MTSSLEELAASFGVATSYVDGTGELREPPVSTVEAIVEVLRSAGVEQAATADRSDEPISLPEQCDPGPQPARAWGVFAPLSGLRAGPDDRRPAADLTTLGALADAASGLGGHVVGTLPLLATAPDEASPYSPVTRRFWDERWVDPAWVARRLGVAPPLGSLSVSSTANAERTDPAAAFATTRAALQAIYRSVAERLPDDVRTWRVSHPEVETWARWRAAQTSSDDVGFEAFAQWAVAAQLAALGADLRGRGVALYLDLPIGTSAAGFDVFDAPEQYALGMSIGAPPDRFFPDGQSWGLVPPLPGSPVLHDALDAHMSVCGLLRIDHVMGLQRLFWIPDGADSAEGTYVTYPARENWATVVELSRRHGCGVVGEDLGTVPDETRSWIAAAGARGLYIAQDEVREPFRLGRPVPASSVASLNTHDLPPFAAWHASSGIDAPLEEVRSHLLGELAASDADVVLVAEQDLSLDDRRLNVPGEVGGDTWRLRSRLAVADLAEESDVLRDVDRWRRTPRGAWPEGVAPLLDDGDISSLHAGTHARLQDRFGVHPTVAAGVVGCSVAVWAPHARSVVLAGDHDGWAGAHLRPRGDTGVWEGFVASLVLGDRYKLRIEGADGRWVEKSDPFARAAELPPTNASIVTADDPAEHGWHDADWMAGRHRFRDGDDAMSIYELHLGSWRHVDGRPPTYRDITPHLVDHVRSLGFTHVELMPVMEHPFGGSWGYHVTGYFAPTTRYGTPAEFAAMVDELHRAGIGVILDWVPAHFPDDEHGLANFDGAPLYEYADPRMGRHPEWGSRVFDVGRHEVRAFLVSSARWWLERFHVDGLRVDAVASMLYRDYGRKAGEWIPNVGGGRENLEAVDFVRQLTSEVHRSVPGALIIAEESTAWPGVTGPTDHGGLGFDLKWDLGWMHDTLGYLGRDPVHRSWHQDELTFRAMYMGSERFVLPLSHDEVVHGKSSLVGKMAGDEWQRRANLRLLFGQQYTVPGVPLVFMGGELAMNEEWDHDRELPWYLLEHAEHRGVRDWLAELGRLVASHPCLADNAGGARPFEWIDCSDATNSVTAWRRWSVDGTDQVAVVANHTPTPHDGYAVGVPHGGWWRVVANSDDVRWGGSGYPVATDHEAHAGGVDGWSHSVRLSLPPLGMLVLVPGGS